MFYNQNQSEELKQEIFENPPAQYRGAPFWAWNTILDEKELLWQIDRLKEMGFGGFFMHSRSGMATEYLSREFMDLVHACIDHAKEKGMLSYLYDEDRWPSGFAGGYVTRNSEYRQKTICLSRNVPEKMRERFEGEERNPQLLAVYDIQFDHNDRLESYRVIVADDEAEGEKWYLYTMQKPLTGYHNGYTYLDTMNPEAVDRFIDVTYEAYKREVGDEFGKNVPAIFTDEPQYAVIDMKAYARDGQDAQFPWTQTFRQTFYERFGYDVVEYIPELVWNQKDDMPSEARYHYYAHASELLAASYNDRIGKWCQKNGIAFTGHVLKEDSLYSQMIAVGEAMRQYKEYTIPGVDMLCNERNFSTVKQAQSTAHQYGREGVTSELYGVTGWDFDFRGHKFQGDWQAALGVTFRVPHLAWVSMRGSAKRDYPASIGYQSSWFREYEFIEDHFARVNTALTRGVPDVKVAVLHPIESTWISTGVREHTAAVGNGMEERFQNVTQWLLRGQIDFDFISESLLPELYDVSADGFQVGKMNYQAVFVPPLVTIRSTTLKALMTFIAKGGKVVVSGNAPVCVDGKVSDEAKKLYELALNVTFSEINILNALEEEREISIYSQNGDRRRNLIYNMRRDGADKWLFIAHCDPHDRLDGSDCACDRIQIIIKGYYKPKYYETINGNIQEIPYDHKNGNTILTMPCHALDSFLFQLMPCTSEYTVPKLELGEPIEQALEEEVFVPDFVSYERKEPNVMVLDLCEWSMDGENWQPREEILRIDKAIRQERHWPLANGEDVQPWCIPPKEPDVFLYLRFVFQSDLETDCLLGYERLEELWQNGEPVEIRKTGYYVDKAIHTLALQRLRKGRNEIVVRVPVSERVSIENFYLIGDFGVHAVGSAAVVTEKPRKLAFGTITGQGMPFYGGAVTYQIPFACRGGELKITADYYNGALISARLDGREAGKIVLPPYTLTVPEVSEGNHLLELTVYASRINTFGALHMCTPVTWKGPNMWYLERNGWAYEYQLADVGIMKKPVLTICTEIGKAGGNN